MCKYRMHLVAAIMLLSLVGLCAQTPEWSWAKSQGSTEADYAESITTDNLGNAYITGVFFGSIGFGSTTLTSAGMQDVFVAKYDRNGNLLWAVRLGGSSTDLAKGVCVDEFYNVYITGSFQGTALCGDTILNSSGSNDIYVAKLNVDGVWMWATSAGGIQADSGAEIKLDSENNIILTGAYTTGAQFGSTWLAGYGGFDVFVSKISFNGDWIWSVRAGGVGSDLSSGVAVDDNGNIYLTGQLTASAAFGSLSVTAYGTVIFIAKLNSEGAWLYATKPVGEGNANRGLGIVADNSGNAYVTGQMSSSITFGVTSFDCQDEDIFVTKLNSNGSFVWVRQAGGYGNDCGYDIALLNNSQIAVTGRFSEEGVFGNEFLSSRGIFDNYVAVLDFDGNWISAVKGGGVGNDYSRRLAIGSDNSCYICGYMTSAASYGSNELTGFGLTDVMIAKVRFPINAPSITPPSGIYPSSISVTLSCNAEGATIYYTQDGLPPTTESPIYTEPILVSVDSHLQAMSYRADAIQSEVCSAYYDIYEVAAQPSVFPLAGTYTDIVRVSLTHENPQARIHYTTDGTVPTEASPLYTSQLVFESSTTLKVKVFITGWQPSLTSTYSYLVTGILPIPDISMPSGVYPNPIYTNLSCSFPGASVRYTLDGSEPNQSSTLYSAPVLISQTAQLKARAYLEDWIPSVIASAFYTITGTCANPQFSHPEGIYTSAVNVAMQCPSVGAVIRFTLDGSDPLSTSPAYTMPVYLETGVTTIKARAYLPGWTPSQIATSTYEVTGTVATPAFSVAPGLIQPNQPISLTCGTNGAEIRYTMDGTDPLSTSLLYTAPLLLNTSTTIKAVAFKEHWTPSAIASASYQISVANADETATPEVDAVDIYPNPFSTSTTIVASVKAAGSNYGLSIYNIKGECVFAQSGVSAHKNSIIWDGLDASNRRAASGVYIVKFTNGKSVITRKLIRL